MFILAKMAPKGKSHQEDETSLSDIHQLLKSLTTEVKDIKTLVVSLSEENKELKRELKEKDKMLEDMQASIKEMQIRHNNLEQHHRGWGARVLNIPVTEEEEADPVAMVEKVYRLALRPMLEGAKAAGKLKAIPEASQVLEVAHVLPGKAGSAKPIIMRFYNRNIRNLVFQYKRDFAPREAGRSGGSEKMGRYLYPLYDDLTKLNLAKMKAIGQDERVQACWTVNGQIRFKLHDSPTVRKVSSVFDSIDSIIKK